MSYQVRRDGQMYGPYTVDELQRYVSSGNILPSDMAMADGAASWVPVSSLVQTAPPPMPTAGFNTPYTAPAPYGGTPAYGGVEAGVYPAPPNLNWVLLLVLAMITVGLFTAIWYIVLASWSKKLAPSSAVPALYIVCAVVIFGQFGLLFAVGSSAPSYLLVALLGGILQLVTRFRMRSLLEDHYNNVEPIGLTLSGVMTFFFGEIYFQYHFNKMNRWRGLR